MFQATANTGQITARAQQICQSLRDNLNQAESFYLWLSAQADTDFTSLPNPLVQSDITLLRAAFDDLHCLFLLCYGMPIPATNAATSATYGITGSYDFSQNVKEVVGGS